jgi:hypothetical protein
MNFNIDRKSVFFSTESVGDFVIFFGMGRKTFGLGSLFLVACPLTDTSVNSGSANDVLNPIWNLEWFL